MLLSTTIISPLRAAVVVVCCRSSISAFIVSWLEFIDFSDGSGSSRVSIDVDCPLHFVFSVKMFPIFVVWSSFLFTTWETKMRSDRSVVTLQVKHVVCLGISTVSSASVANYHTVELFIFPTRRSEGALFSDTFLNVVSRCTVLNRQPLFHPDATFVGFPHCMLPNTKSKLSVEIARDDRRRSKHQLIRSLFGGIGSW